ncbi:MAG: O-antigen ligase family protein [Candidatus Magasanikbacteria bacterium]|nr:O-antigen ligase family protein [Candidatus Magasanikbacteria bacterium]
MSLMLRKGLYLKRLLRARYEFTLWHALLIYAFVRVSSFLTWNNEFANQLIAAILVAAFGYICVKKMSLAWLILVAEFFLNGAGHFFELFGLLTRTWFLGIFGIIWLAQKIKQDKFNPRLQRNIRVSMMLVGFFLIISIINGLINQHAGILVAQDAILYLFFLLLFPALEFLKFPDVTLDKIAKGYILGSTVFSAVTFFIYSNGIGFLPDVYYHWFRNIAAGKITDLGSNFFRIVLPEHLLLVPAILIIAAYLMKDLKSKALWFYIFCALFVIMLNFSRIYFVGLAVGFIILTFKQNLKRWFMVSAIVVVSIFIMFISTHFIASRGQSIGLELLGLRIGGVTAPTDELSGAIRLALLPDIWRTIKLNPWLGSGLGTTVSFIHPVTKVLETRTQFDWGYLEMLAELGILGASAYAIFLLIILYSLARHAYQAKGQANAPNPLLSGLLAGGAALFVINLTTPALFQGFGVLYFVFILWLVLNEKKVV